MSDTDTRLANINYNKYKGDNIDENVCCDIRIKSEISCKDKGDLPQHRETLNGKKFLVSDKEKNVICNKKKCDSNIKCKNSDGAIQIVKEVQKSVSNWDSSQNSFDLNITERVEPNLVCSGRDALEKKNKTSFEKSKNKEKCEGRADSVVLGELKCMQLNAESLANKMDEFRSRVAEIKPDIVGVTETWAKAEKSDQWYAIKGYQCIRSDNEDEVRGGVMILAKDNIDMALCDEINGGDIKSKDSLWVWIKSGEERFIVGCVYRKGTSSSDNNRKLEENLRRAKSLSDKVLIFGDFNFPEIDWENNFIPYEDRHEEARRFLETVGDSFMHQHVMEDTRARGQNNPSCLDLILSENDGSVFEVEYCAPLGSSDHCVITWKYVVEINFEASRLRRKCYYKGDYVKMRRLLEEVDWETERQGLSVNEAYNRLRELVLKMEDECIPVREGGAADSKPPWFNGEAKRAVKKKYCAYMRYRETGTYARYREYIRTRNRNKKVLRKVRRDFEKKLYKEIKKNPKALYKYINSKKGNRTPISRLKKRNGTITKNDKETAEELNGFFQSVFVREDDADILAFNDFARLCMDTEVAEPFDFLGRCARDVLSVIHLEKDKVVKLLKALDPSKTPGPDGLHPKVLMEVAEQIGEPVYWIFRDSLQLSIIPEYWEVANITPIFKGGDRSNSSNYRPVSLTSVLCKTLEKIVREGILDHICRENLFSQSQHGFRNGRSCLTNLLETFKEWMDLCDEGHPVDVVFLDFRKAFDRVPHGRLLFKLQKMGIRGDLLAWIESFLGNRRQRVVLNQTESSWNSVYSGVPQGSVLGPILFLIYINDLPECVKSSCKIFADDTKIYGKADTLQDVEKIQKDLDMLVGWSQTWLLDFNTGKCKVMHVGLRNEMVNYFMEGNEIQSVTEEKDLGVLVDDKLKFSKQIAAAAASANRKLGLLRHTFKYWTEESLATLYKVFVRPHLEYCIQACSPSLRRDINALEKVQRRATKLVPSLRNLPYEERLRRLHLPSLEDRRIRGDMIETFKILKGFDQVDARKFFYIKGRGCRKGSSKGSPSKDLQATEEHSKKQKIL